MRSTESLRNIVEVKTKINVGTYNTHSVKDAKVIMSKIRSEEMDIMALQDIMLDDAQCAYLKLARAVKKVTH